MMMSLRNNLGSVDIHFNQRHIAATGTKDKYDKANLSYRVATRLKCFSLPYIRSIWFRSLYKSTSYWRCVLRKDLGGITASPPCAMTFSII